MTLLVNAALGLLFGLGLVISGMANPAKVLNFLDLGGRWDPSLAFVMAGAVAVAFAGFRIARGRARPLLADRFNWPTASDIDSRVILGPAIFGVGWGLSGFCPGPAVVAIGLAAPGTLAFFPAMLAGIWLARLASAPGDPAARAPQA